MSSTNPPQLRSFAKYKRRDVASDIRASAADTMATRRSSDYTTGGGSMRSLTAPNISPKLKRASVASSTPALSPMGHLGDSIGRSSSVVGSRLSIISAVTSASASLHSPKSKMIRKKSNLPADDVYSGYETTLDSLKDAIDADEMKDSLLVIPLNDVVVADNPRTLRTTRALLSKEQIDLIPPGSAEKACVDMMIGNVRVVTQNYARYRELDINALKLHLPAERLPYFCDTNVASTANLFGAVFDSNGGKKDDVLKVLEPEFNPELFVEDTMPSLVAPLDDEAIAKEDQARLCDRNKILALQLTDFSGGDEPPIYTAFPDYFKTRFRVELLDMRLGNAQIEPFFGMMALYDISAKKRISENLHFDLNPEEFGTMISRPENVDVETLVKQAIFSVCYPHSEIYLVVRVEKVLQGNITEASEPYLKAGSSKLCPERAQEFCSRLGAYRMPFAWTAIPLFNNRGELKMSEGVPSFFRVDASRLTDNDVIRSILDINSSSSMKKALRLIPGHFTLRLSRDIHVSTIDTSMIPVDIPTCSSSDCVVENAQVYTPVAKEITEFPPKPVLRPRTSHVNNLYVYPLSVNFSSFKNSSTKCRNISCKVQLFDAECDEKSNSNGLTAIYGKSSTSVFTSSAFTAVSYHDKQPHFYEEVKVLLPPVVSESHHILFTFYHVSCDSSKKNTKSSAVEHVVGYAVLPLLSLDGQIAKDGDHGLSVSVDLVPGYADPKAHEGEGKPLFYVGLRLDSSVHPRDSYIHAFMSSARLSADSSSTDNYDKLVKSLRDLVEKASPTVMVEFLYVLLDELFQVLVRPSLDGNSSKQAFHAIAHVVDCASSHPDALYAFIDNVFGNSKVYKKLAFEEVVTYWIMALGDDDGDDSVSTCSLMLRHSWFFFGVITKGMQESIGGSPGLLSGRRNRFSRNFDSLLSVLITDISSNMLKKIKTGLTVAKRLNRSIAHFLRSLLSFADRGYIFHLIQKYILIVKAVKGEEEFKAAPILLEFRIEFIRILCNHEHFIPLNLPLADLCTAPISDISGTSVVSKEFYEHHFLAALLQDEIETLFCQSERQLRRRSILTLKLLLAKISVDDRYHGSVHLARIAPLFLPFVRLILDNVGRIVICEGGEPLLTSLGDPDPDPSPAFTYDESRDLLACLMELLKWFSADFMHAWWEVESRPRLWALFDILSAATAVFEYAGRSQLKQKITTMISTGGDVDNERSAFDAKKALENRYSSQVPSMSKTDLRNQRDCQSSQSGTTMSRGSSSTISNRFASRKLSSGVDLPKEERVKLVDSAVIKTGHLCNEVGLVVLDVVLRFTGKPLMRAIEELNTMLSDRLLGVIYDLLRRPQTNRVLRHTFFAARHCVVRFPDLFFTGAPVQCSEMAHQLLQYANCAHSDMRAHASASMFVFMRANYDLVGNFNRTQVQSTIALSKFVGTHDVHNTHLHKALATMRSYAVTADDKDFSDEVSDLMSRLYTILRDTIMMQQHLEDIEMYVDLQYRLARGYSSSPNLRVTWLENIATNHEKFNEWAESAMCSVHISALTAQYLQLANNCVGISCEEFRHISDNVVGDELISANIPASEARMICDQAGFSEDYLRSTMSIAIDKLKKADLFETANAVYKLLLPLLERQRDFAALSAAHADLKTNIFDRIISIGNKRRLATYYRVAFFGKCFGELDGACFVYKEPNVTPLSVISLRLQEFYLRMFPDAFEIIQDSGEVDLTKLDIEKKGYAQVTFVEPYFAPNELMDRVTYFERMHNVNRFVFETPFTKSGKAHGGVNEQWRRRTVLTTEFAFPYVKKRLNVVAVEEIVLNPLEVAVEEIKNKSQELNAAVQAKPTDVKILQMVLQGAVSAAVNQGPLEMANVFLGDDSDDTFDEETKEVLREHFLDLLHNCSLALAINESHIKPNQFAYQQDLKDKFKELRCSLLPLCGPKENDSTAMQDLLGQIA